MIIVKLVGFGVWGLGFGVWGLGSILSIASIFGGAAVG